MIEVAGEERDIVSRRGESLGHQPIPLRAEALDRKVVEGIDDVDFQFTKFSLRNFVPRGSLGVQ